eukprot:321912-Hanusia_phi.AAC.1
MLSTVLSTSMILSTQRPPQDSHPGQPLWRPGPWRSETVTGPEQTQGVSMKEAIRTSRERKAGLAFQKQASHFKSTM